MTSAHARCSTDAMRLVVVVFPCDPAITTPCLRRISSASISARRTTGILGSFVLIGFFVGAGAGALAIYRLIMRFLDSSG